MVSAIERLDQLHVLLIKRPRADTEVLSQLILAQAKRTRVDPALDTPLQRNLWSSGSDV